VRLLQIKIESNRYKVSRLIELMIERIQSWNVERKDIVERIADPIPKDTIDVEEIEPDDQANLVSLGLATPFEASKVLKPASSSARSDHDFSSNDSEEYKNASGKESLTSIVSGEESGHIYDSDSYTAPQTAPHETFEDDGSKKNYTRRLHNHVKKLRKEVSQYRSNL
jgi:hypothetical protein